MASTSPADLAARILDDCLGGRAWSQAALAELASRALNDPLASRALFSGLVEGLADRFEARLCDSYAELFSHGAADFGPIRLEATPDPALTLAQAFAGMMAPGKLVPTGGPPNLQIVR